MKPSAHTRILIGLLAGAVAGVSANLTVGGSRVLLRTVELVTEPAGRMWLSALIMVVIPLILSTLSLGVAGLGSLRRVGRIGLVTLLSFVALTALSSALGLTVMNLVAPGSGLDASLRDELLRTYQGQARDAMGVGANELSIDLLVNIVPRNPVAAAADGNMLAIIFVALMLGVALVSIPEEKAAPMRAFLDSLGHVTIAIIELVMKLAPVGVFCLIFSVTARFGFDLLVSLAAFVVTVVTTLAAFLVVGYSLILVLIARRSPRDFFSKARVVMLTAFTTSSSNATLPTTLRVAREELGIPSEIAGFVLPLGATMNMNGTALFEGATVLFLAQVFGVDLSLSQQILVVGMAVLTAVGTAGIPGGSIPLLMMVAAMVGVPAEGIAIVLGVDRLLDMCRTVLNVTGDLVTASVVARAERGTR
jgi:DAACS family dicarboxylate/amino acid:cation (Na+ or H+) symporter